jgi:hypothetical protein
VRQPIIRDRDLTGIAGKSRAVADNIEPPSTTVHDTKTTDADKVSPVSMPVYSFNDVMDIIRNPWRRLRRLSLETRDGWVCTLLDGLGLIIDPPTTDGPQQDNLTERRTPLTLASLR